jgi:hypothetical protein
MLSSLLMVMLIDGVVGIVADYSCCTERLVRDERLRGE